MFVVVGLNIGAMLQAHNCRLGIAAMQHLHGEPRVVLLMRGWEFVGEGSALAESRCGFLPKWGDSAVVLTSFWLSHLNCRELMALFRAPENPTIWCVTSIACLYLVFLSGFDGVGVSRAGPESPWAPINSQKIP